MIMLSSKGSWYLVFFLINPRGNDIRTYIVHFITCMSRTLAVI